MPATPSCLSNTRRRRKAGTRQLLDRRPARSWRELRILDETRQYLHGNLEGRTNLVDASTIQRIVRVRKANDLPSACALIQRVGFIAAMVWCPFEIEHVPRPHMRHAVGINLRRGAQHANVPIVGLQGGNIRNRLCARLDIDIAMIPLALERNAVVFRVQQRIHSSCIGVSQRLVEEFNGLKWRAFGRRCRQCQRSQQDGKGGYERLPRVRMSE